MFIQAQAGQLELEQQKTNRTSIDRKVAKTIYNVLELVKHVYSSTENSQSTKFLIETSLNW